MAQTRCDHAAVVAPREFILCQHAHTYARFLEFVPEARTIPHQVIPLGIGAPTTETDAPQNPPTALILSRLERAEDYKGHRELIGAWRGL